MKKFTHCLSNINLCKLILVLAMAYANNIFAGTFAARSYLPVEVGLQPVKDKLNTIGDELREINKQLSEPDVEAKDRAEAYRRYKVIEPERQLLQDEIEATRKLARNPLVRF
jgi:hypothetical protein